MIQKMSEEVLDEDKYLRYLETVTLAPTKGDVTLAKANQVLNGWIDDRFNNWITDVSDEDTDEANVDVYEMVRDGYLRTLFSSLGDPYELCLTQGQIVEFCLSHPDLLRQERSDTFFLLKVKRELSVPSVIVFGDRLRTYEFRFRDGSHWFASNRFRLAVLQPAA